MELSLIQQELLAEENPSLRYPKFDIMSPPFKPKLNYGKYIKFYTFVKDNKSDKLVFVSQKYDLKEYLHFEYLSTLINKFKQECQLIQKEYIFNNNNSIIDPYVSTTTTRFN